jgi:hypothetical protein
LAWPMQATQLSSPCFQAWELSQKVS